VELMHEQVQTATFDHFLRRWWPGQLPPQPLDGRTLPRQHVHPRGPRTAHHRARPHRYGAHHVAACSLHRPRRRRRRALQPMPHVRRGHHTREPAQLDRGAGPAGGAAPEDRCRRPQEAQCPDSPSAIQDSKRYLEDFGRLQQSTTTDEELFNE
jgi:hypothetical protein